MSPNDNEKLCACWNTPENVSLYAAAGRKVSGRMIPVLDARTCDRCGGLVVFELETVRTPAQLPEGDD